MRAKYIEIAELINTRIDNGYYLATNFPGERALADELGVSYMTARRAIQKLFENQKLFRQKNGRMSITNQQSKTQQTLRVAMVIPAYISASINKWWLALEKAVSRKNGTVRMIPYLNWKDPIIWDAVNDNFDCIFLVPPREIPKLLEERLVNNKHKIVSLFADLTNLGISGLDGGAPENIKKMFEHLAKIGHKSIDCLNTEPAGKKIDHHIRIWREILKEKKLTGNLHNNPTEPFTSSESQARNTVLNLIKKNKLKSTAIYCVTVAAAKGAMRALQDNNIQIGKEIAVCSFGGGEEAKMMIPSLTVIDTPDPTPILTEALEIFCARKKTSPTNFIQPEQAELFLGESTQKH